MDEGIEGAMAQIWHTPRQKITIITNTHQQID